MSKIGGARRRAPGLASIAAVALALPLVAAAPRPLAAADEALVERGRYLFTSETFGGNGRTCSTCHRPDNNYTIDPAYVAKLPAGDPLFLAETDPSLAGLDRPKLLRRLALVTVHVDGFDKPGVPRAVPHLLGLRNSMKPRPGGNHAAALGWSGDGAPGKGSLRDFVLGAVTEHMPKSLARRPGVDFRLPSEAELAALGAFLLSLGGDEEFDLSDATGLRFASAEVERGRILFNSPASGPCSECHRNGGALDGDGFNRNADIGVQHRPNPPVFIADPEAPADAGFGAGPATKVAGRPALGDGRFNTPTLVHAADTVPLFHDNSAGSIEAAVVFYTLATFHRSPEGKARKRVALREKEVVAIAAMLRTLSAMDDIRASNAMLGRALAREPGPGRELVRLAAADTQDAIEVLTKGVSLNRGSVRLLREALTAERQASETTAKAERDGLLRRAIDLKARARALMVK